MPNLPIPSELRAIALALYETEIATSEFPLLSPGEATKAIAEQFGVHVDDVASPVANVYYRENGVRHPLVPKAKGERSLAAAVAARREDAGETFASEDGKATGSRWETLGASLAAAKGERFVKAAHVREAKRLYQVARAKGEDEAAESYIGRGTYASAQSLRA